MQGLRDIGEPRERHSDSEEGYAAVANWISRDEDGESQIYRRFGDLSTRNLLYLQAELSLLRKSLDQIDRGVVQRDADMELKDSARTYEVLLQQSEMGCVDAVEHLKILKSLREKIKEYHEALILQAEMFKLSQPSERAFKAYETWFNGGIARRQDDQKSRPILGGVATDWLDKSEDLVALRSHPDVDILSRLLRRHWPAKTEMTRDGVHEIGRFHERSITLASGIITIVISAALLAGSITGFYFVKKPLTRLLMIYAFTIAFAISISIVTNAKRSEIFAATAAYAAVLVVFVSNGQLSTG